MNAYALVGVVAKSTIGCGLYGSQQTDHLPSIRYADQWVGVLQGAAEQIPIHFASRVVVCPMGQVQGMVSRRLLRGPRRNASGP